MMNKDMLHRMKIAGEYQRKAVRALFPEQMGEHLDVIEKEMKMMVMEVAAELMKDGNKDADCRDADTKQGHEQTSKVKKVDIV